MQHSPVVSSIVVDDAMLCIASLNVWFESCIDVVSSIVVDDALPCCALLHSMCDLKAA